MRINMFRQGCTVMSVVLVAVFLGLGAGPAGRHYEGTSVSKEVVRLPGQDLIRDIDLRSDIYEISYKTRTVLETHWELDCDVEAGDGSHGDWHNYWSVPKYERPVRLAAAVKGIGLSSATRIVNSGIFFQKKPRSWNAFKMEIRRIDNTLGLYLYSEVIVKYGRDNARNLGYESDKTCQWVLIPELVTYADEVKTFVRTERRRINLRFEKGTLLSNESEKFEVRFDGFQIDITEHRVMNQYERLVSGDDYIFRAVKRTAVVPSADAVKAILLNEGGTLKLKVTDALYNEVRQLSRDSQVEITYKVVRSKYGPDNAEAKGVMTMPASEVVVDLKTHPKWEKSLILRRQKKLTHGQSYYVTLSVRRLNTQLFSDDKSETITTSTLAY